jgi:hypothetical protein
MISQTKFGLSLYQSQQNKKRLLLQHYKGNNGTVRESTPFGFSNRQVGPWQMKKGRSTP